MGQRGGDALGAGPAGQVLQVEAQLLPHQAELRHIALEGRFAQVRLQGGEQGVLPVRQPPEQLFQGVPPGGEGQGGAGAEIGSLAGVDVGQIQNTSSLSPVHWMARSLSQLGRALALMLDTMPMAAYRVRMDEPP